MILYVCSKETDYLQDLTYAGLAEMLGKERIFEVPRRPSYHNERKFVLGPRYDYPQNLGFTQGKRPPAPRDVELIVLASAKPDALETFAGLMESSRAPWVFVDGGDRREIGGDFERTGGRACFDRFRQICNQRKPAVIFKRELWTGEESDGPVPFPFSFKSGKSGDTLLNSCELSRVSPDPSKTMDVLFWAVESSLTRKRAFEILRGRYDCGKNGSVPDRKARRYSRKGEKYFAALASAKICLSFRGEGFDTLRYWEIPASGSFMISESPVIRIPENFENGTQAVFCRPDLSDLTDKIDYYLRNEKEREEIAAAGRGHLLARHTHLARAEYFIAKVKERLGLKFPC